MLRIAHGLCWRLATAHQHGGNVGKRPVGHFLGQFHHHPFFDLFVQMLAQFAQSSRRSDDDQGIVIARQRPNAQLVGGIGCIAILILLVAVKRDKVGCEASPGPSIGVRPAAELAARRNAGS